MMVKDIEPTQKIEPFIDMTSRQFANVLFVGLGVGIVTWLLQLAFSKYVFGPIMCNDGSQASCGSVDSYASIGATIIGAAGGLVALVRIRVYRPLLVVLAAVISLWGLFAITGSMMWTATLSLFAVLHAGTYGLFVWLARIRSFLITIVTTVIAVVLIRLFLG